MSRFPHFVFTEEGENEALFDKLCDVIFDIVDILCWAEVPDNSDEGINALLDYVDKLAEDVRHLRSFDRFINHNRAGVADNIDNTNAHIKAFEWVDANSVQMLENARDIVKAITNDF